MIARYATAITAGTFMTVGLLFVMQILIDMQSHDITHPEARNPISWLPYKQPTPPPPPPSRQFEREELTTALLQPTRSIYTDGDTATAVQLPGPPGPGIHGTFRNSELLDLPKYVDGSLIALIRVAPTYPLSARRLGLEGHVLVQFDVLPDGHVANVVVVESSDQRFDKEALSATRRFKFRARVVDGVPLLSTGVQNLFTFEMDNE